MRNSNGNKFFNNALLKTKVTSANVKWKESIFGYFIGPFCGMLTSQIFVTYLNMYWTDVLGIQSDAGKLFFTLMPLISIVFIIIGNFVAGRLIDRTKTSQGKARPYLLLAAVLLVPAGILLYAIPAGNVIMQLIVIAIAYNLYYSVAYPLYSAGNSLMVPLSTRNGKQRNMLSSMTNFAGIGATSFAGMIMPMFLPLFAGKQSIWIIFMCGIAVLSLVGIIVQYYFTRERVTEENFKLNIEEEKVPLKKQVKALLSNKYWIIIMIFFFVFQFVGTMQNFSIYYFSNYVQTPNFLFEGFTMTFLNIMSGIPMAVGMFIVWPLANKFGKKPVIFVGLLLSVLGCLLVLIMPESIPLNAVGMALKGLGSAPAIYMVFALIADVLDNVEAKNGFRADGLSVTVTGIVMSILFALCQGIFNGLTSMTGYLSPADGETVVQNEATQNVITWCFVGFMMVGYAVCAALMLFMNVEKHSNTDHGIIIERQKATVLAAGGEWVEPSERLRIEQEEADLKAEQYRIEELKIRCDKKGLSFEDEEAKVQAKRLLKQQKCKDKKK